MKTVVVFITLAFLHVSSVQSDCETRMAEIYGIINTLKTQLSNHNSRLNGHDSTLSSHGSSISSSNSRINRLYSGPNWCNCHWTAYKNSYDRTSEFYVANGLYITGVYSVHDSHYEDRKFKYRVCSFCYN